jgi:hypothetical protein
MGSESGLLVEEGVWWASKNKGKVFENGAKFGTLTPGIPDGWRIGLHCRLRHFRYWRALEQTRR